MLLACDIGNTRIKSAIFDNTKIIDFKIITTINELFASYKNSKITSAAFSSVVPERSKELTDQIKQNFDIFAFQIGHNSKFNLKIDYLTPETLGIDRICSAEGAFSLFKKLKNYSKNDLIISIDFGTATTLNFVKFPGVFVGGIIAPGIELMSDSLNSYTAQLPEVSVSDYKKLIGRDTKESIASGVVNSTVGLIEKSITEQKDKTKNIHIYVTGGNASKIIPYLKFKHRVVNELVLIGIKSIYEKNVGAKL